MKIRKTATALVLLASAVFTASGCVSRYGSRELSKVEEDRAVLKSSDRSADETLEKNPQYLTDVKAVRSFAGNIQRQAECRPVEVSLIDIASRNLCKAIEAGASEEERRHCFRRLYEFQYRVFLRFVHRRAGELAEQYSR